MDRSKPAPQSTETAGIAAKEGFEEPEFTYVKPEITELGRVEELTAFFGPFSP